MNISVVFNTSLHTRCKSGITRDSNSTGNIRRVFQSLILIIKRSFFVYIFHSYKCVTSLNILTEYLSAHP